MTDTLQTEKDRLLRAFRDLESRVSEQTFMQDVTNLASEITNLPNRLQAIRQRGYAYAADLESTATGLAKQWKDLEDDARYRAQRRFQRLSWDIRDIQDALNRVTNLDNAALQTLTSRFNGELTRVEQEITDSRKQVMLALGPIPDQIQELIAKVSAIESYMKHGSEAGFSFNPAESVIMAVEANWKKGKDNKENPNGILYVTNQRLIMEQNEKKGGFAGIGGNKVQQLAWDVVLTAIQGVSSENKGLFGNIDLVHIRCASGPIAPEGLVEIKEGIKSDWFADQVRRAVSGDFEKERVTA